MFDFYQRRKLRSLLAVPLVRIVLVLIFFFIAYSAFVRYQIAAEMAERREVAEVEVAELREQKERLEEEVEYLRNERGIEAEMRRQFDIALPGEEVVVLLPDESAAAPTSAPAVEAEAGPWYQFWR